MNVSPRSWARRWLRLRPRTTAEVYAQVDEEIAFHLEQRISELMRRGLDEAAARIEAERRFGEGPSRDRLLRAAEQGRRKKEISEMIGDMRDDAAYAIRSLGREPALAFVVVATLAIGIGANATMFSIVDRLLLRGPTHVVEPEQVRRLYTTAESFSGQNTHSYAGYITYTTLRERATSLESVAAYRRSKERMGDGRAGREVSVMWSTPDLFPLLGVSPAAGRFFTMDEDRPRAASHVAVISHALWLSEYGGNADAFGQMIKVGNSTYEIVGVAPRGLTGPELGAVDVWIPLTAGYEPHPEWPTTLNAQWIHIVGRLRAGVTWERADAEITGLYRALGDETRPAVTSATLAMLPLGSDGSGGEPSEYVVARWLTGVSLIVLFIACANVANLLLGRGIRRRREIGVRVALGVSRGRLLRLLLTESLVLAVAGGAAALVLCWWGAQVTRALLLPDVAWDAAVNARVVIFTAAVTLVTTLLIGLVPALRAMPSRTATLLRSGTRELGQTGRLRHTLTVVQAAFSLVLLVGAGLFVKSLWNVNRLDLGVDADRVVAVWPPSPQAAADWTREERAAAGHAHQLRLETIAERLRAQPQVENAALAIGTPFQGNLGVDVEAPGIDSLPKLAGGGPYVVAVGPRYFETVGTQLLSGRSFAADEGRGTERVVIVNRTMAATLWPGEDAFTKCLIIMRNDCARVVGIVEDARRRSLREEPSMQYYIPLGQETGIGGTAIAVRARGRIDDLLPILRRQMHEAMPEAEFFRLSPLQQVLEPQLRPWRLGATMFTAFGFIALLIAAVGLYSVIAYGVVQRRTEIGVRMALGARAASVAGMVLRQGMGLVLAGVALGVPIALLAGRFIQEMLFDTSARDAGTFVAVALLLTIVATAACLVPAARAAAVSPADALRGD